MSLSWDEFYQQVRRRIDACPGVADAVYLALAPDPSTHPPRHLDMASAQCMRMERLAEQLSEGTIPIRHRPCVSAAIELWAQRLDDWEHSEKASIAVLSFASPIFPLLGFFVEPMLALFGVVPAAVVAFVKMNTYYRSRLKRALSNVKEQL